MIIHSFLAGVYFMLAIIFLTTENTFGLFAAMIAVAGHAYFATREE